MDPEENLWNTTRGEMTASSESDIFGRMAIAQLQNYQREVSAGTQRTKIVPARALKFHCDPYSVR